MKVNPVHQSIIKTIEAYKTKLNSIVEPDFQTAPPMGGWSYSEVYSHIFDASLLSLIALNSCIKKEGAIKPTLFIVKLVLFFGMFPPGKKYKAPSKIAARVKKIGITAAQQFITDFELQLVQVIPKIDGADPKIKVKHPVLLYLNAKQWLRFIEIHLKHHLKQLQRIENSFKQQS
ncbi:DinB family protein [Pedobacter sp. ASV28]|uniref:DinB family protein n=1 Tax=Pedobacter sp. ASV28 TaxID=2795123 RepID=UPI0018EADE0E|nr:DinB family protein [Pedobacter sp. ASV28]